MAALRRLVPSLTTGSRTSSSPAATALKAVAVGAGVTAAASAAYYCCSSVGTRSRLRSHVEARLLHLALPSVSATDKVQSLGQLRSSGGFSDNSRAAHTHCPTSTLIS